MADRKQLRGKWCANCFVLFYYAKDMSRRRGSFAIIIAHIRIYTFKHRYIIMNFMWLNLGDLAAAGSTLASKYNYIKT